jgi:proline iminopeptidase
MKRIFPILFVVVILMAASAYCQEIIPHNTMTSDSVRIYYETQGEGVPIFMIAGGPGGSPSFFRETHKLWLAYGMLVYVHNRGRGKSEMLDSIPGAYSPYKDILDIEAVRKDLGADKIVVYGHSYGSMVALLYVATYPENCLAVMTTGALAGAESFQKHNIDAVKYFMERNYPDEWDSLAALHAEGYLTSDEAFDDLFPDITEMYYYNPDNNEGMGIIWRKVSDSDEVGFNYEVYKAIVGDDPEWTVSGTLKGLELPPLLHVADFPALIMGGRYDRVCPPVVQRQIAASIPDGKLVIFDKSGHRPFIEEPVKFFEITGEFLRQVVKRK